MTLVDSPPNGKKVYVLIYLDLAMDVSMAFDTIYLKTIEY